MDFSDVVEAATAASKGRTAPDRALARFAMEPEHDEKASREAGRVVIKMAEFCYIRPGGGAQEERFRANSDHRKRFPQAWRAFQEQEESAMEGTPIDLWNGITRAKAMELQIAGIRTVEQLAEWDLDARPVSSANASVVEQARDFVAGTSALQREVEELRAEVEKLRAAKPKRGRPRKETTGNVPTDDGDGSGRGDRPESADERGRGERSDLEEVSESG